MCYHNAVLEWGAILSGLKMRKLGKYALWRIQSGDRFAGKKVLGDTECCLYKVDESMKKMLTSYVDSNRSMNRAHGSNNISMVNRDRKSEMQANVLLVNFPCDQKIPQQFCRSCSKTVSPTLANSICGNLILSKKLQSFLIMELKRLLAAIAL